MEVEIRHTDSRPTAQAGCAAWLANCRPRGLAGGLSTAGRGAEVIKVDLAAATAGTMKVPPLRDGDVVHVAKRTLPPVYVIGLVRKPGEFPYPTNQQLRVLDALALAGGVSNPIAEDVLVLRQVPGAAEPARIAVSIQAAKNGRDNLALAPGDTVSVEQTPATVFVDVIETFFRFGVGASIRGFKRPTSASTGPLADHRRRIGRRGLRRAVVDGRTPRGGAIGADGAGGDGGRGMRPAQMSPRRAGLAADRASRRSCSWDLRCWCCKSFRCRPKCWRGWLPITPPRCRFGTMRRQAASRSDAGRASRWRRRKRLPRWSYFSTSPCCGSRRRSASDDLRTSNGSCDGAPCRPSSWRPLAWCNGSPATGSSFGSTNSRWPRPSGLFTGLQQSESFRPVPGPGNRALVVVAARRARRMRSQRRQAAPAADQRQRRVEKRPHSDRGERRRFAVPRPPSRGVVEAITI